VKKLTFAAFAATQMLSAAQPAAAADLVERNSPQMGGARDERRARAGLTLAPTMRVRDADGGSRLRFGEGLELGIAQGSPLELSFAGRRVDRLGVSPRGNAPGGQHAGVSTLGWVAIGVGTVIIVTAAAGYLWLEDALDCDDPSDDC